MIVLADLATSDSARGLAGGQPNAKVGNVVDLGCDTVGVIVLEAEREIDPSETHTLGLTCVVRTRGEFFEPWNGVVHLELRQSGARVSARAPASLRRFTSAWVRQSRPGPPWKNIRVRLETLT